MFTTVSLHDFRDWYTKSESYGNNFSYEGLASLFEYLEELEDSTGEQIEFDPIALACEFTEWENINEYNEQMDTDYESVTELSEDRTVIQGDHYGKHSVINFHAPCMHSFITSDSEG
jgi:hypothetical protein